MAEAMSKARLLETLQTERARWDALVAKISPERMCVPATESGWSAKDIIAHVTYYERWMLGWLEDAVRGKLTAASHRDLLSVDERNTIIFEENRDRPLDDLVRESRSVFERLVQLVQMLPERDLLDPHRYERYVVPFWYESHALWECIAGDSYEHYEQHIPTLRTVIDCAAVPA